VPRFFPSSLPFALLIPCFAIAAHAQRLPTNVRPEHYTLSLTPDLKTATFTGKETIDVVLDQSRPMRGAHFHRSTSRR
jgi:hypothetical protein